MRLSLDDLTVHLGRAYVRMLADNLSVGLVTTIGPKTRPIGEYFSEKFGCELANLPSLNREGRNEALARILNTIYPYLPIPVLRLLSREYMRLYQRSKRSVPNNLDLDSILIAEPESTILLVDDNSFTGKTFELWKEEIKKLKPNPIVTFSVTVTGDYRPDYYCIEGWRSFEWRAIGV
ncbi:hypothetical protein D6745_04590 [Candidatus Woesearchaeota archaeon]|nr:MAG: hypothetical protein D6745_04590 [Candidatus Woesearchaeota archaeon]